MAISKIAGWKVKLACRHWANKMVNGITDVSSEWGLCYTLCTAGQQSLSYSSPAVHSSKSLRSAVSCKVHPYNAWLGFSHGVKMSILIAGLTTRMMISLHARSKLSLTSSLKSEILVSGRLQPVFLVAEHDDIHQQGMLITHKCAH